LWIADGLKNVRFSGGEPTLHPLLSNLVAHCLAGGVERIAVSSNGASGMRLYELLVKAGVNDFSISLDACCAQVGEKMSGRGSWGAVVDTIRELSKITYVSVGMVFTDANVDQCLESVLFADSLGVSDIRVIPSAQYNHALVRLSELPAAILAKYPILRYRVENITEGHHVRGMDENSPKKCSLVLDDSVIAGGNHYPCVIYMREGGKPIGEVGSNMREERAAWREIHSPKDDPICSEMCLDICMAYNRKVETLSQDCSRQTRREES